MLIRYTCSHTTWSANRTEGETRIWWSTKESIILKVNGDTVHTRTRIIAQELHCSLHRPIIEVNRTHHADVQHTISYFSLKYHLYFLRLRLASRGVINHAPTFHSRSAGVVGDVVAPLVGNSSKVAPRFIVGGTVQRDDHRQSNQQLRGRL